MAASTSPQMNAWADTRSRVISDQIVKLQYMIDAYLTDYAAQGVAALAATDASNNVGAQDGRAPITGTQVLNQKAGILAIQTAIETTTVAGVGATNAAINAAIQVNGSPH